MTVRPYALSDRLRWDRSSFSEAQEAFVETVPKPVASQDSQIQAHSGEYMGQLFATRISFSRAEST